MQINYPNCRPVVSAWNKSQESCKTFRRVHTLCCLLSCCSFSVNGNGLTNVSTEKLHFILLISFLRLNMVTTSVTVIFISPSILLVFFCPCKSTHFLIFAALISPSSIVIMIIRTCTYCTDSGSRKAVGNDRLTSGARANTADRHLILVSDRSSFKQRRIPLGRAANLFHWASAARWPEKLQLVRGLPLSNHSLCRLAVASDLFGLFTIGQRHLLSSLFIRIPVSRRFLVLSFLL